MLWLNHHNQSATIQFQGLNTHSKHTYTHVHVFCIVSWITASSMGMLLTRRMMIEGVFLLRKKVHFFPSPGFFSYVILWNIPLWYNIRAFSLFFSLPSYSLGLPEKFSPCFCFSPLHSSRSFLAPRSRRGPINPNSIFNAVYHNFLIIIRDWLDSGGKWGILRGN